MNNFKSFHIKTEEIPAFLHVIELMITLYERTDDQKLRISIIKKLTDKNLVDKLDPEQRLSLYERVRMDKSTSSSKVDN